VREVSIVTHQDFGKQNLTTILAKEILQVMPTRMIIQDNGGLFESTL